MRLTNPILPNSILLNSILLRSGLRSLCYEAGLAGFAALPSARAQLRT